MSSAKRRKATKPEEVTGAIEQAKAPETIPATAAISNARPASSRVRHYLPQFKIIRKYKSRKPYTEAGWSKLLGVRARTTRCSFMQIIVQSDTVGDAIIRMKAKHGYTPTKHVFDHLIANDIIEIQDGAGDALKPRK